MSLLNKAAVKRSALDLASAKFKERNKTRLEMGQLVKTARME